MSASPPSSIAGFLRCVVLAALVAFGAIPQVHAWGANGHRIIAAIAEERVAPSTRDAIEALIGPESLVDVSTWADDVKSDPAWDFASPWHYVSVPDGADPADVAPVEEGDILRAIGIQAALLADRSLERGARAEALRFVVHFVGDMHQPLHVGRLEDRGGNRVEVTFFGETRNLHWVWDTGILASQHLSYTEYTAKLRRRARGLDPYEPGGPLQWARESATLRDRVYRLPEDRDLGFDYVYETLPVVDERLLVAGQRLARYLDELLSSGTGDAPETSPLRAVDPLDPASLESGTQQDPQRRPVLFLLGLGLALGLLFVGSRRG